MNYKSVRNYMYIIMAVLILTLYIYIWTYWTLPLSEQQFITVRLIDMHVKNLCLAINSTSPLLFEHLAITLCRPIRNLTQQILWEALRSLSTQCKFNEDQVIWFLFSVITCPIPQQIYIHVIYVLIIHRRWKFLGLCQRQQNMRPDCLTAPPFIISFLATENWPKMKLSQVEISLNIAQNHLSSL